MARDDDDVLNPHMNQDACAKWYAEFYTRPDDVYCAAVWDTVLCWPPTLAGATVSQRCPRNKGIDYTKFAYKTCSWEGVWEGKVTTEHSSPWGWTNYTTCLKPDMLRAIKKLYAKVVQINEDREAVSSIGWTLEKVALSVSLVALVIALVIFQKSRSLRSRMTRLHKNLFSAMLAQVMLRLLIYADRDLNVGDMDQNPSPLRLKNTPILCEASYVLMEYARTAMFVWMLIDALFIHELVIESALKERLGYRVCLLIGWGSPVLVITAWATATALKHHAERCLRGYTSSPYFWVLEGPRVCVMLATFLLLFNVLRLLLTKYKNYNSEDIDRARRSVRMALLLLPLLVINDVFLLARTSKPKELWQLKLGTYTFRLFRGCQGIFVALIYCLLRREVLEGGKQMVCYYIASRRYERARHDDSQLCETEDQTQAPSEAPSNTINLKETVTRWFKH